MPTTNSTTGNSSYANMPANSNDPLLFGMEDITTETVYSCPRCLRVYKNKSSLSRHRHYECHENVQRVACGHCGKKMNLRCNMLKHIRFCHPGKPLVVLEYSKVADAYVVKPPKLMGRRVKMGISQNDGSQ